MRQFLHPYLRKTLFVLPVVYIGGWTTYYVYTDVRRRWIMSSRTIEYERGLAALGASKEPKALGTMSQEEKELLKQRYASMKVLGRYTNPFVEWREQGTSSFYCCLQLISLTGHPPFFVGVHEWFLWKLILTPLSAFLPSEYASLETLKQLTQVVQPSWEVLKGLEEKLTYTWIGQSTSYVQMSGLRILTDPIFSDRTLDGLVKGPKRLRPPPCELKDLETDVVLVSHNHFDHLDIHAVKELGNSAKWFVPLGIKPWFEKEGVSNVCELDWWESADHTAPDGKKFRVTCAPTMHWSGRNGLDTNTSLWASFHIEEIPEDGSKGLSFYHAGDTGYSPTLFEAVGQILGPVTLAAIPIGSYGPSWHLELHHENPLEATNLSQDVGARYSVGVHWGTWEMSDEPPQLPPHDLEIAKAKMGLGNREEVMRLVDVGQTLVLDVEDTS